MNNIENNDYFLVNLIIPFSNVDGPGNRFAIFLQGCNFNCMYCHNPETINLCKKCYKCISYCKTGALTIINNKIVFNKEKCINCDLCIKNCENLSSPKTINYSFEKLFGLIEKHKHFITGITFSGGEATLTHEKILIFAKLFKIQFPNLTIFVDTNGSIDFKNLEFVNYVDSFMLDVKAFNSNNHVKLTGMLNLNVLKNLDFLILINKLYEVRIVVFPEIINLENLVLNIAKKLKNTNIILKLIKYRQFGVRKEFANIESPSNDLMQKLSKIAENYCEKVVVK